MGFELGVILPNYGEAASADAVLRVAVAAEEAGLDSVWATEHVLVGRDAAADFGRVLAPLETLAWLAGRLDRVGLGTSIVVLPLHNPIHVAKETATLQDLSGGRLRLGVGVGWHADEFRFLGAGFHDRGRRADEGLRLIRALWAGRSSFHGEYWSFDGAAFDPLPDPVPEIWIGGGSLRALRRAREVGDVWHPNARDVEIVREGRRRWPEGRIVPRVRLPAAGAAGWLKGFAEAGADGLVIRFATDPDETVAAIRRFSREALPELAEIRR